MNFPIARILVYAMMPFRVWSCLEKWVEFWAPKNLQNPCQIFNRTSALKSKSHFSEKSIFLFFVYFLFIFSQVTRKTKPEIKQELQDWNYNFFEDFAMLGAPEKVAYNFKTLECQLFFKKANIRIANWQKTTKFITFYYFYCKKLAWNL